MGYYTRFRLRIFDVNKKEITDRNNLYHEIKEEIGREYTAYACDIFDDESKWYDYDEDMRYVSKNVYPSLYLVVDGDGEEDGDIWSKVYFKGEVVASWELPEQEKYLPLKKLLTDFKT